MATIRRRGNGSWEIVIRRKILNKAHFATADTEEEAKEYASRIESLLDQGILPNELIAATLPVAENVSDWAREYMHKVAISEQDHDVLGGLFDDMKKWPLSNLTIDWAQKWVTNLKRDKGLAPSTIRHKVGAVARLLDWSLRNGWIGVNPLRMLPKKYATYTKEDGDKREDVERDRVLLPGEHERIMSILDGGKPEGRQRGIKGDDRLAWRTLFILATETAMRLREMYSLSAYQVDLAKKTVFLEKTKNGDRRQVPLSSVALAEMKSWMAGMSPDDLVFPWWDGDTSRTALRNTTNRLSRKWGTIANLSGCEDLHFHDLRHDATCQIYLKTTLSDVQIARITGHKDLRTLKRYANLRGSELAEILW